MARVGKQGSRVGLLRAAQSGEKSRNGGSWVGSDSPKDGLSGWSGSESVEGNSESQSKTWLGGLVGAGAAGLVLMAGLTFAVFSLSKQSSSRPKQQMQALTTQQEVSLTSDDQHDATSIDGSEGKRSIQDDSVLERITGDSEGSLVAGISESSSGPKENLVNVETNTSSIYSNVSATANLDTDYQQGMPELREIGDSDLPLDYPFVTIGSVNEHLVSDASVTTHSDSTLESLSLATDIVNNVAGPSPEENLGPIKTVQVSVEGSSSFLDINGIGNISSTTLSVSESSYAPANEQVTNGTSQTDGGRSILESTKPTGSFSSAGIPAPSAVPAALQVLPGKVLVPAVVDQVQGQALAALQAMKNFQVIEADIQPSDLCTRREYARWLVSASSALSRNTTSKVYPAMYIENVTELAFDDVAPEDPDFASIQGLAEAGLISSKLSRYDLHNENDSPFYFSPASPLSRQDLVSWKMALEKKQLPEADRKILYHASGYIDVEKIDPDACPAIVADLSAGEQGIIALAFGYTKLFQPDKPVTKAQAAIALATGEASEIVSEELARVEAESMAENAVAAHNALVAEVEKDINASFKKELSVEREKIDTVQKMAKNARYELERLRAEREEDGIALMKERAAIESEMEVLSRLRREVEEQLQSLTSDKVEIAYEKERINKLRKDAEIEKQEIERLQYELEVERKALSMARAWAEEEARKASEQAKALEEARDRWERHGIKVVVGDDLREETTTGVTWLNAGKQFSVEETVQRGEKLVDRLHAMAADVKGKSRVVIDKIIHKIVVLLSNLKEWISQAGKQAQERKDAALSAASRSARELQQSSVEFGLALKDGAKRIAGECREGVEKLTQKFKA